MIVQKDPKTGLNVLVPNGKAKKIGETELESARLNISKVLGIVGGAFSEFAKSGILEDESIDKSADFIKKTLNILGDTAKNLISVWSDDEKITKASESFKNWIEIMVSPAISNMVTLYSQLGTNIELFDKSFEQFNKPVKMEAFSLFTENIVKLAKAEKPFEKFVNTFERFGSAMGVFGNNFKIMDTDGIKAFDTWSNTLLRAVEIGENSDGFNGFIDSANTVIDGAFQFGKELLGSEQTTNSERKDIIEKTNEPNKDKGSDKENAKLLNAISSLQEEVAGLKSLLGGTLNINIESASSSVVLRTEPEI